MNEKKHNEEDFVIPFVCDECKKTTSRARELTFYFKDAEVVTIKLLCYSCVEELKKIQEKIKGL